MSETVQLLRSLVVREIRVQYLESLGGLLWTLVLPLLQLAVYAFVFTKIFQVRLPGADLGGFVPYLAVAMWPWNAFAESLSKATAAITDNEALIGKVALPKQVLVTAAVTAPFLVNMVGYLAVLVILAATGTTISLLGVLLMLPVLLSIYLFTLALALIASATQVFIRDLRHALTAFLMIWFFSTPIIYALAMVPERYHVWYELNPFTHYVEILRGLLLPGASSVTPIQLMVVTVLPLVLLWLGGRYFGRLADRFEDFL